MGLIEIDGLQFLVAWWIFPWRTVSHTQMVNTVNVSDSHPPNLETVNDAVMLATSLLQTESRSAQDSGPTLSTHCPDSHINFQVSWLRIGFMRSFMFRLVDDVRHPKKRSHFRPISHSIAMPAFGL